MRGMKAKRVITFYKFMGGGQSLKGKQGEKKGREKTF